MAGRAFVRASAASLSGPDRQVSGKDRGAEGGLTCDFSAQLIEEFFVRLQHYSFCAFVLLTIRLKSNSQSTQ